MIVVSNEQLKNTKYQQISYDTFKAKAFSDEGLDVNDTLVLNANDVENDVFDALREEDVKFFTLTGKYPDYIDLEVEDWSNVESSNKSSGNQTKSDNVQEIDNSIKEIGNLLDESFNDEEERKDAKMVVFGSSKGGTGKTFTSIISTYRYAKTHPHQKIALIDFDIIDGQVGISIHKIKPTMRQYFTEYKKGYSDFNTMRNFSVKGNDKFPQNVDFYLAPSSGTVVKDDAFWLSILKNCSENYDVVVIDTGIDYLNITPISYAYKIADKVVLITTTSIKSVNSVTKQIGKLKGENKNNTFSPDDEIGSHLNVVITQMIPTNEMNNTIYATLSKKANVIATFGVITDSVSQAEFYGSWDVFDKNTAINTALDQIMS